MGHSKASRFFFACMAVLVALFSLTGCAPIAYIYKRDAERALADLNQALKYNPKDATAYFLRGALYLDNGEQAKATADFNAALQWTTSADLKAQINKYLEDLDSP